MIQCKQFWLICTYIFIVYTVIFRKLNNKRILFETYLWRFVWSSFQIQCQVNIEVSLSESPAYPYTVPHNIIGHSGIASVTEIRINTREDTKKLTLGNWLYTQETVSHWTHNPNPYCERKDKSTTRICSHFRKRYWPYARQDTDEFVSV